MIIITILQNRGFWGATAACKPVHMEKLIHDQLQPTVYHRIGFPVWVSSQFEFLTL